MKKIFLAIFTLLCLQNSIINCGFFSMIGMFACGMGTANSAGKIVYPKKDDDKVMTYGKAFAFTCLTWYFGYQFFKNFQK